MNKFLITTLCMVFLIGIGSVCALEEFSPQAVEVDEFIKANLSDYTMQKRIPLEGMGMDYAVARESGNIVAITEDDNHFNVYYFDIEGNELWKKEIHEADFYGTLHKVKSMTCAISDNGKTICLYISPRIESGKATGYYGINNTILSKDGEVLFTEILKGNKLIPSPDGQYLYKRSSITSSYKSSEIELYKTDGSLAGISGFDNPNIRNVRIQFLTNNLILAYVAKKIDNKRLDYLTFLKFDEGSVTTLSEHNIDLLQGFDESFRVKFQDDKVAICSGVSISKLYVFNFDGELLDYEDMPYKTFDFTNDDELFLQTHTAKGKYSKLINLSTKESRKEDIIFGYGRRSAFDSNKILYDVDEFSNAFELNDMLIFSIGRYPESKRKYCTIILDKNDWSNSTIIDPNMDIISVNDTKFVVVEKYYDDPELIILRGGEK